MFTSKMDVVLKSPLDRVSGRVVAVLYSYIMIRICYIFLRYDGVRRTLLDLYDARSLQLQFTSSRRQIQSNYVASCT
jgi:hypothetical protein